MITSETNYFKHYEELFYKEKRYSKKRLNYGLQTRVTKVINVKEINKLKTIEDGKRLSEYDNLKQLIKFFLRKEFPYISFIFGGFDEIHNYSYKYRIPLLGHDNCNMCKEETNLKSKKNPGFLDKIYDLVRGKRGI